MRVQGRRIGVEPGAQGPARPSPLRWSITLLLIGGPARRISLTAAPGPRVLLGTDAVRAEILTSALQEAIARRLPAGGGTVTALMPAVVGGIASETPLDVADLAAIAAACV